MLDRDDLLDLCGHTVTSVGIRHVDTGIGIRQHLPFITLGGSDGLTRTVVLDDGVGIPQSRLEGLIGATVTEVRLSEIGAEMDFDRGETVRVVE